MVKSGVREGGARMRPAVQSSRVGRAMTAFSRVPPGPRKRRFCFLGIEVGPTTKQEERQAMRKLACLLGLGVLIGAATLPAIVHADEAPAAAPAVRGPD